MFVRWFCLPLAAQLLHLQYISIATLTCLSVCPTVPPTVLAHCTQSGEGSSGLITKYLSMLYLYLLPHQKKKKPIN